MKLADDHLDRLTYGIRAACRNLPCPIDAVWQRTDSGIVLTVDGSETPLPDEVPDADGFVEAFIARFRQKLPTIPQRIKVNPRRIVRMSRQARAVLDRLHGGQEVSLTEFGGIEAGMIAAKVSLAVRRGDVVLAPEIEPEFVLPVCN